MYKDILIIGKKTTPIGGVTIYVKRLLELLESSDFNYSFYDLKSFSLSTFIKAISNSFISHLHTSSPCLRVIYSLLCHFLGKKSIITYHGNLGRFNKFLNALDFLSVKWCTYPIVLNEQSFVIAKKLNSNAKIMSVYISPIDGEVLDIRLKNQLIQFRSKYCFIVATNAYNYSVDSCGNEIYGITDLINFFGENNEYGFVVSDPSGNYAKRFPVLSSNIFVIDYPHPFQKVLDYVDCFIRYTSTDGDSISIYEALEHGVPVLATDVVSRPQGVHLIRRGDIDALKHEIELLVKRVHNSVNQKRKYPKNLILNFYQQILK